MKKLLLLLALVCVSLSPALSQKYSVGGQLGLQLPMGSFGDVAGTGVGLQAIGRMQNSKDITLRGTLGYFSFGSVTYGNKTYSYSDIPIMAGVELKVDKSEWNTYAGAEIGFHFLSHSEKYDGSNLSYSETDLAIGAFAGIKKNIGTNMDFIADAKFNMLLGGSNFSYFGINAGVVFYLK